MPIFKIEEAISSKIELPKFNVRQILIIATEIAKGIIGYLVSNRLCI